MILTVTINPLLERRFSYKSIEIGGHNRGGVERVNAGGKGINVSRQLNILDVDNLAFTFLGGTNGKTLRDVITGEGIKISAVKTAFETREAAVIIEETSQSVTTYFSENSKISSREVDEFKTKLEKMIQNCEIVIFSGSSPCPETDSIFPYGLKLAHDFDKISICDTYGEHLKSCISASPTILHNNVDEVEKSLTCTLRNENEKIEFLDEMYNNGIKQVYLTDGSNPTYASNFDFHFKVENPEIKTVDPTGSGDSFTAGISYGWHKNLTFEDSLIFASSMGIVNASRIEISDVKLHEIDKYKNSVKLFPIGKKMKTVDVTPR